MRHRPLHFPYRPLGARIQFPFARQDPALKIPLTLSPLPLFPLPWGEGRGEGVLGRGGTSGIFMVSGCRPRTGMSDCFEQKLEAGHATRLGHGGRRPVFLLRSLGPRRDLQYGAVTLPPSGYEPNYPCKGLGLSLRFYRPHKTAHELAIDQGRNCIYIKSLARE